MVDALKMLSPLRWLSPPSGSTCPALKRGAALLINQPRDRIRKMRLRIIGGGHARSVEKKSPTGSKPLQHVVDARGRTHQLFVGGAIQIRAAIANGTLETSILVEDNAGRHQTRPGQ